MRIIITDTSFVWKRYQHVLEQFKDVLLVVCLDGKAVSDKYECFVSPYKDEGELTDYVGVNDPKYKALKSVAKKLNRCFGYHDHILFLSDYNPTSLYPFYVLKDIVEYNRLHLSSISPLCITGTEDIETHKKLFEDLSKVNSFLYVESKLYLDKISADTNVTEVIQKMEADYIGLLPTIVNNIEKLYGKYYFDFSSNSYIEVEKGFSEIDFSKKKQLDSEIRTKLYPSGSTLGMIMPRFYPVEDDRSKAEVERLQSRIDGKKICEYLRKQRIELAEKNGIEFFSDECPSIGPCAGTCEKCDQESAYLRDKLNAILQEDRIIPDFALTEWEVEE